MNKLNENAALDWLKTLLEMVPCVDKVVVEHSHLQYPHKVDGQMRITIKNVERPQLWLVEAKSRPLEPREADFQSLRLRELKEKTSADYAVVVAPYVSPASAELLSARNVGFCDLSGNCHLVCGGLYLERTGFQNKYARKSSQRSLYARAAERILRALLDPVFQKRNWTVRDLSAAAYPGVSLGQTQKVLKLLEDWQHVRRTPKGSQIIDSAKLLNEWAQNYRFKRNKAERYYTLLTPDVVKARVTSLAGNEEKVNCIVALASFSAAAELAPAVRQHRTFIYWKGDKLPLIKALELEPVSSDGENIVIYEPYDDGVFYPVKLSTLPITCPVQTYVDLRAASGRGVEAAEALFQQALKETYNR